jgi:hypothetical protein
MQFKSPRYASRTVTIKPSRFNFWVSPIICLSVAGAFLSSAYENLAHRGLGDAWFVGAFGVGMIGAAVLIRRAYIRVDDSTITLGPNLTPLAARRNIFNRQDVALIRATHSPWTRRTLFLRSDGSTLSSTSGLFWGRDGLQKLADYLGVPLEW